VAEAVETAAQVAILREVGADVGQGYFFAPPLGADEALALTSLDALPLFSLSVSAADETSGESVDDDGDDDGGSGPEVDDVHRAGSRSRRDDSSHAHAV
jgi:predicted signal transduction protein with EAL and GGDEF domain